MANRKGPRYLVIEEALRRMIGERRPGDQLPSDNELAQRFGVSRMTARHGTQRLAQEGLLYRVSGVGTFIAQTPIHRHVSQFQSFTEEMRSRGLEPHSKVLEARVRRGTEKETVGLRVRPGDRVVHIRRIRLASGIPIAVQSAVLQLGCAPVLQDDLARSSLHELLRGIGRAPAYAQGGLSAVPADQEHAELLGLEEGAPLLLEVLTVFDPDGEPIEFAETRYAGGRYVFDIELARLGVEIRARHGSIDSDVRSEPAAAAALSLASPGRRTSGASGS